MDDFEYISSDLSDTTDNEEETKEVVVEEKPKEETVVMEETPEIKEEVEVKPTSLVIPKVQYTHLELPFPFIPSRYSGKYHIDFNFLTFGPRSYIGDVLNGKKHGYGKLIYDNDNYREGNYINNKLMSGVVKIRDVMYDGVYVNQRLHDNYAKVNKHGFIYRGKVHHGIPMIDEGVCGFEKDLKVNFMGFNGEVKKAHFVASHDNSFIEGVLEVQFEKCFIRTIHVNTCLYSEKEQVGDYYTSFPKTVKITYVRLMNGKSFNYNTSFFKIERHGKIMYIQEDYGQILNLCNYKEQFIVNGQIHTTENNSLIDIPVDDIEEWGCDLLVMWAVLTFPHFKPIFFYNLKYYGITGEQFKGLKDCHFEQLLGGKNMSNEVEMGVYVRQIRDKLETAIQESPMNYYHHIMTIYPSAKKILEFINKNKLTHRLFCSIDDDVLYDKFDKIRVYQIKNVKYDDELP